VAIHEVMEQQTVTIAKAGIHAALNARCSVVAAANPIYGQYDKSRRPQENIGLPDSLLSRFDLLFIVLDQMDPFIDRTLSEHVIKCHSYRRPGTIMEPESLSAGNNLNGNDYLMDQQDGNAENATPVWLRSNPNQSNHNNNASAQLSEFDLLNKEFLRKYIHYAKMRCKPILSDEASDKISNAYANMRAQQNKKNLPITARTLETMIRLSTAAAKCRLSDIIEETDVDVATELLNFVLFHEIGHHQHSQSQQNHQQQQQQQQTSSSQQSNQNNNTAENTSSLGSKEGQIYDFNTHVEIAMKYIHQSQASDFDTANFTKGLMQFSNNRIKHADITKILDELSEKGKVRSFLFIFFLWLISNLNFSSRSWWMAISFWSFNRMELLLSSCFDLVVVS
jgi:DNA replication licensing factor MCM3